MVSVIQRSLRWQSNRSFFLKQCSNVLDKRSAGCGDNIMSKLMNKSSNSVFMPVRISSVIRPLQITALVFTCAVGLTACGGSGGGSDSGGPVVTNPNPGVPQGLVYSYPFDGQDNVTPGAQILLKFSQGMASGAAGDLSLATADGEAVSTTTDVTDNNTLIALNSDKLATHTEYVISNDGDELVRFTTAPNPLSPSADGFAVDEATPGPDGLPFVTFNTLHLRFSEAADPNTLVQGEGFSFADSSGTEVPGNLYVQGRNLSFDPTDDQLAAGETYTVTLGPDVKSVFGNTLQTNGNSTFTLNPRSPGNTTISSLSVTNLGAGSTFNAVDVGSQLLGDNALDVQTQGAVLQTEVSQSIIPSTEFGTVMPIAVRRGGGFNVAPLEVTLNGEVPANLNSGILRNAFITDLSAYFTGNPFDADDDNPNTGGAIGVRMRFDIALSGSDERGNGAFNQNVLNVPAVGTVTTDGDGNLTIEAVGSFPVAVNRTGQATTNFRLRLSAPAADNGGDVTGPRITAQYPSACAYTFNTEGFEYSNAVSGEMGLTTLSAPEADCIEALTLREDVTSEPLDPNDPQYGIDTKLYTFTGPRADSLPLRSSPSITFSEPVDPTSLGANIMLINNADSTEVPARLRSEGASVVIDPVDALAPDTQYTVQVGFGVTDLAGNTLAGSYPDITFNTEPMVVPVGPDGQPSNVDPTQRELVRQAAPFLTVLTPGMPCALQSASDEPTSDFRSGGDVAGRCVGDAPAAPGEIAPPPALGTEDLPANFPGLDEAVVQFPAPVGATINYPVFPQPTNVAVDAYFSKPVRANTIQLADGCLIGGGAESANTVSDATVAIQVMDDSGNCTGVVGGSLAMLTPNEPLTRGFTFRPVDGFTEDQRYWTVICGSDDPINGNTGTACSTNATILGQSGLKLNTNPLLGTGSRSIGSTTTQGDPCFEPDGGRDLSCYDDNRGQGGPDITMPFEGTAPTRDFYATTLALPETDTNGNGYLDNQLVTELNSTSPNGLTARLTGEHTDEQTGSRMPFNDSLGVEHIQQANIAYVFTGIGLIPNRAGNINRVADVGYLSGGVPTAIRQRAEGESCAAAAEVRFDDGTSVLGTDAPDTCVPVDLLPGGLTTLSNLTGGGIGKTGRALLRFPYGLDEQGNSTDRPQTGYIVPECTGTDLQGEDYRYAPCFVANLTVTVIGNDGSTNPGGLVTLIPQQDISVQAYGPVAFEQNGRLVISTKNANAFSVTAVLSFLGFTVGVLPAPTFAGGQSLQLVGPAIHGGRAFTAEQ